ncbi:copper homeostasis protein CutC [Bacillus niameyensis]|uniref:copper homeostasis protein CutC n=1 Tax=Bacillus niameyensis TaxID=1522308 RepID=UPI000782C2FC|nr:copper homeostasis protein CutC [Bacillus niameyensis]
MIIEVIVQNFVDAIKAEELGVDRLELVSAIEEGGLTPSAGVVKSVLENVSIPVQVMVRPHGYSHVYSKDEIKVLLEDIKYLHELGVKGIVIGAINPDHTVNIDLIESIIHLGLDLDITFHRAFDEVRSLEEAYRSLIPYSKHVKRILTSGGKSTCLEGVNELQKLVELSKDLNGPEILPGAGLSSTNIKEIHEQVKANQYHFGKAVRINDLFTESFDSNKIDVLKGVLK